MRKEAVSSPERDTRQLESGASGVAERQMRARCAYSGQRLSAVSGTEDQPNIAKQDSMVQTGAKPGSQATSSAKTRSARAASRLPVTLLPWHRRRASQRHL